MKNKVIFTTKAITIIIIAIIVGLSAPSMCHKFDCFTLVAFAIIASIIVDIILD